MDAKIVGTGNSPHDFREGSFFSRTEWGRRAQQGVMIEARSQSVAANSIGATVEWIVPAGTPADVVTALQQRLRDENITNISVVVSSAP